jgi:diguanylate cyclase (GGDEF)-like protein
MPDVDGQRISENLHPEWMLELTKALHTTLELPELLQLCSRHLEHVVPHTGIEFRDVSGRVKTQVGQPRPETSRHEVLLVGEPLGEVRFARLQPFTEQEARVLEAVATNLAHPLRNALLYRDAVSAAARDPLTGVNNRASLEIMLEREAGLARRYKTPLSLIMLDADRFKEINDTYGHLVGDAVLKALVSNISACVRDSDPVFRYGGEEFVVMLSNTSTEGAALLAERIRATVATEPVPCRDHDVSLTISLGVASLGPGDDHQRLLTKVDQALYRSKAQGRNRVTVTEDLTGVGADDR